MRCPRCGNENPDGHRFCGMCGATLLAAEVPLTQTQRATASAPIPPPVPTRPRAPEPARPPEPPLSISGPSFLGLGDQIPRKRPVSIDPNSSSSGNLDYLLDDEEERHHFGAGKVLFILLALFLAAGFGYLRWKGQKIPWLNSNKPAAAQNTTPIDSNSASAPTSIMPPAQPQTPAQSAAPSSTQPAAQSSAQPNVAPGDGNAATATGNSPPAAATSAANPNTSALTEPPSTANPSSSNAAPNSASNAPSDNASPAKAPAAGAAPADTSDNSAADEPAPKPAPTKPVRRTDPVAEAQKYLYGRDGVRQDCERGLQLLKPAANASNPKAMVEMGALYSAGLCTPHDLPTAYRWFALALRKDPSNQAIQTDLSKLWGEMTQPERQLAIKLSQ